MSGSAIDGRARVGAWAMVALVLSSCAPPDHPPRRDEGLPGAAIAYLEPERVSTFRLEEGATYRVVRSGTNPWTVHLLDVDVRRCEMGFRVVSGRDGEPRLSVAEMAWRSEPGVIAAVNGDFFTPESLPLGVEVSDGALRGRTSRPVFAWRPGEVPWVGPVTWAEGRLRIGPWTLSPDRFDFGMQVVAGFPPLLAGGRVVGDLEQAERPDFAAERHPRTAVGMDSRNLRLWIVVVDGRTADSDGMTLPELAQLFRALGAGDAINLDGGSSSVMVVRGETVNHSAYVTGERSVVNALVVRKDPAYCM
jgi:hypothetical protein